MCCDIIPRPFHSMSIYRHGSLCGIPQRVRFSNHRWPHHRRAMKKKRGSESPAPRYHGCPLKKEGAGATTNIWAIPTRPPLCLLRLAHGTTRVCLFDGQTRDAARLFGFARCQQNAPRHRVWNKTGVSPTWDARAETRGIPTARVNSAGSRAGSAAARDANIAER